ncbi:hypothetical protein Tco_0853435 [Tanacetum coccineum]
MRLKSFQEDRDKAATFDAKETVGFGQDQEDEQENFALMAYSNSGSDTEETTCPPKSDFGIDESNFTYDPKQSKTSESDAKTSDFDSCKTNSSVETLESVPEPVVVEPKVVSQPKVWSDAPIIEDYESDSDDEYVIEPLKE